MAGMNEEHVLKLYDSDIPRDKKNYGFQQPIRGGYENSPDTNLQARSKVEHPYHQARLAGITTVVLPETKTFVEPASTMASSKYPNTKVWETPSGHLIEVDDTEDNERILVIHKSGSYMEMTNDGMVQKIAGDKYSITAKDENIGVGGSINLSVEGDCNIRASGVFNVENASTFINTGADTYIKSGNNTTIDTLGATFIKSGINTTIDTLGETLIKTGINTTIDTIGFTNIKSGLNTTIDTGGETLIKSTMPVTVEAPMIDLGILMPEPMVLGNKLASWISSELATYLNSHTHVGNMGAPTSPPLAPFMPGTAIMGGLVYSKFNKTQ